MKGRITCNKLRDWVNEKFIELGITAYVCTKVERTHYSQSDIEGGACRLLIFFDDKDESKRTGGYHYFMSFYPICELQKYVAMGYQLSLQWESYNKGFSLIKDLEIVPIK